MTARKATKPCLVVCQDWEESERGWGTRPDGFTLHLTEADRAAYVQGYYETFNNRPSAPDEYTRTSGKPRVVAVTEAMRKDLKDQKRRKVDHEWQKRGVWGEGRRGPPAYTP
jgi:hypothetical protein